MAGDKGRVTKRTVVWTPKNRGHKGVTHKATEATKVNNCLCGWFCFSGRIKHAPNRGYHFVSPSPLFLPERNLPFSSTRKPPFLWKSYYFYRISCMNPLFCFPPRGNGGQKATRNSGPQFGACLILSELLKPLENRHFQKRHFSPILLHPVLRLPSGSRKRGVEFKGGWPSRRKPPSG